jgi:hypothetical protein
MTAQGLVFSEIAPPGRLPRLLRCFDEQPLNELGEAMNSICKSKLEHLVEVQEFWTQQRNLCPKDQIESKLAHLQVFIQQLGQATSGKAELQCRFERFGDCQRLPDEITSKFYGRLRRWLDRDIDG